MAKFTDNIFVIRNILFNHPLRILNWSAASKSPSVEGMCKPEQDRKDSIR